MWMSFMLMQTYWELVQRIHNECCDFIQELGVFKGDSSDGGQLSILSTSRECSV